MTISRLIILRTRSGLDKVVEKIKAHMLCSTTFFRKLCRLRDNAKKYGGARETTNDNMAHARYKLDKQGFTRALAHVHTHAPVYTRTHTRTHTHIHAHVLLFHGNSDNTKVSQCYVMHTLPVLLDLSDFKKRFKFLPVTAYRMLPVVTTVHYRIHKSPPPVPTLSQIDPVHTPIPLLYDLF